MNKDYAADRAKMRSEQTRRSLGIELPEERERRMKREEAQRLEAQKRGSLGRPLFAEVQP